MTSAPSGDHLAPVIPNLSSMTNLQGPLDHAGGDRPAFLKRFVVAHVPVVVREVCDGLVHVSEVEVAGAGGSLVVSIIKRIRAAFGPHARWMDALKQKLEHGAQVRVGPDVHAARDAVVEAAGLSDRGMGEDMGVNAGQMVRHPPAGRWRVARWKRAGIRRAHAGRHSQKPQTRDLSRSDVNVTDSQPG